MPPSPRPGLRPGASIARPALALFLGLAAAISARAGLSVSGRGELLLDGRPFRGIGVNAYDLFVRTLHDPSATNRLDASLAPLSRRGIPFARFAACGYWPADFGTYRTNRAAYFARLDAVVAAARRAGIGLVPSLFWHPPTVPDLVGEPAGSWGVAGSRTHAWMRTYVAEVAGRYAAERTIWAWEFGNEHNLAADLPAPEAAKHRPPVVPALGTPTSRSASDDITHAGVRTALGAFAREVRRHDPSRAVLSGHAFPRVSAWHQEHAGTWDRDTTEQFADMLEADHPAPLGMFSGRLYEDSDQARLPEAMRAAKRLGKPLFLGEFGVPGTPDADVLRRFREQLAAIEEAGVPLAAVWVYDYPGQDSDWNITDRNARREMLDRVAEANRRLRP